MVIEDLKQTVSFTLTKRTLDQLHELVTGGYAANGTAAVAEAVELLYERRAIVTSETIYENALAGIRAVFGDNLATTEEIEINLQVLRDEIKILIESLQG